ncbi:MAG: BatA domain-containing protein [Clostridiales bacterium]|jgi:hypothetical protein|nr:BatA domain-containing protein [Eubacteriales bacterium]MDH7566236.1 BatA domain-containing protein [Clostridiales bacterium]
MKFLQPLGFLTALLLPAILLLYFKKKQVVEYRVSWLELWEEVVRETEGLRVGKIRNSLLLVLQLLIGVFIVLSAARPIWVEGFQGERAVVALDCSISMKARENGKTRFEEAREKAMEYVQTLPDRTRITLLVLKSQCGEYLADADKSGAVRALKEMACSNESLDVERAGRLLSAYSGEKAVFTDKDLSLGAREVKVGGRLDNAGITGAKYDYYSGSLQCRVKNYSAAARNIGVEAVDSQGKKALEGITLPSSEEGYVSFKLQGDPGPVTVKITGEDMLEEDNSFVVPLGEEYKTRVLLLGDSPFLQKALESIPGIKLESSGNPEDMQNGYDLCIVARKLEAPQALPACSLWNLFPGEEMKAGKLEQNAALEQGGEALTVGLSLTGAYAAGGDYLKQGEGYGSILLAGGKPVMTSGVEEGRRMVYSSLDLSRTNLVMLPAFPILVRRTVSWLSEDREKTLPSNPPSGFVTGEEGKDGEAAAAALPLMHDLKPLLLMAVLLLMAAEPEVYRHEL